jgi:ABC-2 type transport system permease protein
MTSTAVTTRTTGATPATRTSPTAPPPGRSLADPLRDAVIFVGRSTRHSLRSVDALVTSIALPVVILLLFVYVFGGALRPAGGYVDYVVPGIILLCAGFGSSTTAVKVNEDMTSGVIDRFRSMPIAGSAVLAGHVVASVARNLVSTVVVLGVALVVGFRPGSEPLAWLAVVALLALYMTAVSWLAAAFGLIARSAEGAGAFSFFIMFLPYLSSAFVPTDTMPPALQGIADHQPVTPIIETLRGLMMGTPVGNDWIVALGWCLGGVAVGGTAAAALFGRRTAD